MENFTVESSHDALIQFHAPTDYLIEKVFNNTKLADFFFSGYQNR